MQLLDINNILELLYKYHTELTSKQEVCFLAKDRTRILLCDYMANGYVSVHGINTILNYRQTHWAHMHEPFTVKLTGYKRWCREGKTLKPINRIRDAVDLYYDKDLKELIDSYRITAGDLLCN